MAAEKNSSSASSLASLRLLKLEEDTLLKLSAQMRDQLNRLKVEELSLKSQLRDRDIKLATSSMACATPSAVEQAAETSRLLAATSVTVDVEQKVNLIDLDLEVPINTTAVLVPNEVGSSDEEFDEEECLLKL